MECPEKSAAAPAVASPKSSAAAKAATKPAPLTLQQRDALFEEAAKGIEPLHKQAQPEDPLKPWWPQIKKRRHQGYSSQQIRAMLAQPQIGADVSLRTLQRFMRTHDATAAKPAKG